VSGRGVSGDHTYRDRRVLGGVAGGGRAAPRHRWVVIVRAVAEGAEPVIAVYSAEDGDRPDEAEQARLLVGVGGLFRDRWGKEPERSAVAVMPWVEADGDVVNWRLALRRLGVK
jgi:hypothetical protein